MIRSIVSALIRAGCAGLVAIFVLAPPANCSEGNPEEIRFNRDVRPVLSENCFACHGPDQGKRKARLRLDTREGLFADRDGERTVAEGQPERSLLYQRIVTEDELDMMPPPETGKSLTEAEMALVGGWIAQGARWEGHWAYVRPSRPPVPRLPGESQSSHPIDAFIQARLAREGVDPSPSADPRTLIRRLSYDLIGLPPTPREVRSFAEDATPSAYAALVERLLASPHYGERMAMVWLDLVRYADTDGYHADNYRSVWPYRDYVIDAFNSNLPFDQFTIEQIAGDLLPGGTLAQRVASTYNRLGRTTEEGGAQPKEYLTKYASDRVRSLGTVWLGSTTGCAECHDHKFDPYTTKDFYSLAAYFADVKERGVGKPAGGPVPSPEQADRLAQLDRTLDELRNRLNSFTPESRAEMRRWEQRLMARVSARELGWEPVRAAKAESAGGAALAAQPDLSLLSTGEDTEHDAYSVTLETDRRHITGVRMEVYKDADFPNGGLGRGNGNFILTEFEVAVQERGDTELRRVPVRHAIADFSQASWPIAHAIDGKADTGWAVAGHENPQDHAAAFILSEPIEGGAGTRLAIHLRHDSKHPRHNIGKFRLSLISVDDPTLDPLGLPGPVIEALRRSRADRTPKQRTRIEQRFLATTPSLATARQELKQTEEEKQALVARIPTTLMTEAAEPRITRVLPRGDWMDESGEVVEPTPPDFLETETVPERRATRLDLARWLVSPENPLTARVFVNRLWRIFFGAGISRNLEDLGAQGEWPTHPELLDWLATEFVESGWDVKHMVRLMVTSAAYRQASFVSPELRRRDPFNRLFARQARFRLSAELVRDGALSVSGLLAPKVGGPSVKPYQPPGYWSQMNFPKREWQPDRGDNLYRRGLYVFWCRTFLHPSLQNFDACTREEGTAERSPSNTPLQALTLLNDPTFAEAARVFGERIVREGGQDFDGKLDWAFGRALSRSAEPAEQLVLAGLYARERQRFDADPAAAAEMAGVGERPQGERAAAPEIAAWSSVARAILNLHESIVRN